MRVSRPAVIRLMNGTAAFIRGLALALLVGIGLGMILVTVLALWQAPP